MHPVNCDKKSDKQLIRLTLKNTDYFECLVERYEAKLSRYIRRITNFDKETIEDLLQEVFLKVYKNLNDFDASFSFSSWIYRIAHNEAISNFRKMEARPKAVQTDEGVELLEIIPSDFDLSANYAKKELGKKVRQIIDGLSAKYRDVLILRFLEDKSYEEISDILQVPHGTVATLLNRAKAQFKESAIKHNIHSANS